MRAMDEILFLPRNLRRNQTRHIVPFPVIPLSRANPTKLRERGLKGFGKSNHLLAARRARTFDRHSQFAQPWQRLDGVRNPRQSVLGQIPLKRNWVNEHDVVLNGTSFYSQLDDVGRGREGRL